MLGAQYDCWGWRTVLLTVFEVRSNVAGPSLN